jgi:antitoxin MazE
MQVSRWGNSLAVRLPKELVEAIGLKEGDNIELRAGEGHIFDVYKHLTAEEALKRLKERSKTRPSLPEDYVFDRDEANAR